MRYPTAQKSATRRRIVAAASEAFRECGVDGTGVDEIMRRAGLTHGGFYAHFNDKSELLGEACMMAFDEAVENLARISAQPTATKRARLLIDSYLSTQHRDNRGSGCLVVAVATDMARLTGPARVAYSRGFERHIERLCAALRLASDLRENRERVTHLMSSLVGALILARATDDSAYSTALLLSSRRTLRNTFASPP